MSSTGLPFQLNYVKVAPSLTARVLTGGGGGGPKDYLGSLVCAVLTAPTSNVTLLDGAVSMPILPTAVAKGNYTVDIGATSKTVWKVTTGAGVSVIAIGIFT